MSDETQNPLRDAIEDAINENPVILFMKGTPEQPMCGFSARTVARAAGARARRSRRSTSCPTRASARSSRRCRTGRRSRSCSSAASWSAAATSSPRCTRRGELAELLGVEQPEDAASRSPEAQPAPLSIENRLG